MNGRWGWIAFCMATTAVVSLTVGMWLGTARPLDGLRIQGAGEPAAVVEAGTVSAPPVVLPSMVPEEEQININTAGLEELMTLDGIGEKRAQSIIDDREANGPFRIPEEITRVSGIGEGILEGIIDRITV